MRLDEIEESSNVEDRRGSRPGGKLAIGGGLGGLVIVIIYALLGGNPQDLQNAMPTQGSQAPQSSGGAPINDEGKKFVSKVLKETEVVWDKVFQDQLGKAYEKPSLVVFSDQVQSGCGIAETGVGPFYCSADSKVYIDLAFYETMEKQLGAGGDFAQAYVVAHEVGHHVQNLLGTSDQVNKLRARLSEKDFNKISVKMELQADFLAGVWAHYATELQIDEQDVKEAMNAAQQIGDDTLQKRGQGYVNPDSFTHGTSAQRVKWFMAGLRSGKLSDGDTFNTRNL
ncbi:MAG: neutral zinc metallopeptidase [Armatimonadota bacterium]